MLSLLVISVTYMIVTLSIVRWKYKFYLNLSSWKKRFFDFLHIVISVTNIILFWSFALINYNPAGLILYMVIGAVLIVTGIVLIIYSMIHLRLITFFQSQRIRLIIDGPYRNIRHPIYMGGILGAIGLCLLTQSTLVFVYTLVLIVMSFWLSVSEEPELHKQFGQEFEQYYTTTGRFLPKFNIIRK
jgi:protein-S-isoprenylcysteine O-methyltransferase Ste14